MGGHAPRSPLVPVLAAVAGVALLFGAGVHAFARIVDCAAEDRSTLDVAVAPELLPVLNAAGRSGGMDGDTCVRAEFRAADPAAVTALLTGRGSGVRPDVWIPDSSLWTAFYRPAEAGASLAQSPIVVATMAPADPSWSLLLGPATETITSGVPGAPEPRGPRPRVPDPARSAVGMGALLMASKLLAGTPDAQAVFTGLVRAVRENTASTVDAAFGSPAAGVGSVVVASEQAALEHNRRNLGRQAYVGVPKEGTVWLDYPYLIVTSGKVRAEAARKLESDLRSGMSDADLRRHGFRTGQPPPQPPVAGVRRVTESYARLSLTTRMLVLFDISGSMAEKVGSGQNRLQATQQVAQTGLQLLSDDSELGVWAFSTDLRGRQDWAEVVPVAPLGSRVGSVTQRQHILSGLGGMKVKKRGDTALYTSLLAALRQMRRTYAEGKVNTVLVFTDGRNDDPGGPGFQRTLRDLRAEYDPDRPVQLIIQGFGDGVDVDVDELTGLANATHGIVQVAHTAEESKRLLLEAMSRRVCSPEC